MIYLKRENKIAIISVFLIGLILVGAMSNIAFAGVVGCLMFLTVSLIFFTIAMESIKDIKELKKFIVSGELDEKKFERIKGLVQNNGIVKVSDEKYAVHVEFGAPINFSFDKFPKIVLKIREFFDSLVGLHVLLAVKRKSYGFDVYAVKNHDSKVFGRQINNAILFVLFGLTSILFAFIIITTVTFRASIGLYPFIALGILLFISFFFALFVRDEVSVKLKKVKGIDISPFWDISLFKSEYKALIDYQRGRFIELLGFILSGIFLVGILSIIAFVPAIHTIIEKDYYMYPLAFLVMLPSIISEFIASSMKAEYRREKTKEILEDF